MPLPAITLQRHHPAWFLDLQYMFFPLLQIHDSIAFHIGRGIPPTSDTIKIMCTHTLYHHHQTLYKTWCLGESPQFLKGHWYLYVLSDRSGDSIPSKHRDAAVAIEYIPLYHPFHVLASDVWRNAIPFITQVNIFWWVHWATRPEFSICRVPPNTYCSVVVLTAAWNSCGYITGGGGQNMMVGCCWNTQSVL